ncbi:uncharacterized protein LOC120072173 [Benincasa hispida]|uniref:uncharacterized protein LOC120072173 n=1 Tax=Benincasa hispida TaxID=102211 RepID=UPI001902BE23|nr:uncharacterized protein LOC120072173 [Benincasa hispida]
MASRGIVLRHIVSEHGIEVDPAKIDIITKLSYPTNVREVHSFLGHASFYHRKNFDVLKNALSCTLVNQAALWDLPFEIMCDTSDHAIVNPAQCSYTTTEKKFLAVIFALEKFRSNIIGSEDKKGCESVVVDHLSRIAADEGCRSSDGDFPDHVLMQADGISITPWYADIMNYLTTEFCHKYTCGGHFSPKRIAKKVLDSVDYVSKWVEAKATITDDAKVVAGFLKTNILCRFCFPKEIISDQGSHFCNRVIASLLKKYGV